MKQSTYLTLLALAMLVFSCNCNDDDSAANPIPATNYLPLTVGNYWVYQWYKIDASGNETPYGSYLDSVYVSGDTLINGFTYHILEGRELNVPFRKFYRDSSGYLVSTISDIPLFSTTSTTEQLGIDTVFAGPEPLAMLEYAMQNPTPTVTVPAGTFSDCLTTLTSMTSFEDDYPYGIRTYPYHYAEGIGRVQHKVSFYGSPDYLESRLLRYHIE
ncbi:MAG: hypothetical protein IT258_17690 [Saprospiraceae bacterium]|nr:hypothetical protein [Saprospiraceae bacterium]